MQKTERIEEDIKFYLSKIISERVKDPNITGVITITTVKVTKDLKYATIYTSVYGCDHPKKVFEAIQKSKGFIRRELGMMLKARNIPDLIFKEDDSMEYGAYMNKVIEDLHISKEEDENKDN